MIVVGGSTPDGGLADLWLMRTDADGEFAWSRTYGGAGQDAALDVVVLPNGDLTLSGTTYSKGAGEGDFLGP